MKTLGERKQREREREEIIGRAVETADRIILDGSDGSCEETNYLTAKVAEVWVRKALLPLHSSMYRADIK